MNCLQESSDNSSNIFNDLVLVQIKVTLLTLCRVEETLMKIVDGLFQKQSSRFI